MDEPELRTGQSLRNAATQMVGVRQAVTDCANGLAPSAVSDCANGFAPTAAAGGQTRAVVKPFYFFTVLWGERFRNYFLEYCAPSLLAPGNIPSLQSHGHKYLLATTRDDWSHIDRSPVTAELRKHCELVFLEIDYPAKDANPLLHMGIGHKLSTELCFRDKALGVMLQPDLVLSDGSVAAMQEHALNGSELVLCPALRFAEEPLFAHMTESGYDRPGRMRRDTGEPLVLAPRDLVRMAMRALHSETATYDFEKPYFRKHGAAAFWPVPRDGGIVLHSFSWCPMLMDYGVVHEHDVSSLDHWTIDGSYLHENFAHADKVHICSDSDEIMLVSFSPSDHGRVPVVSDRVRERSPFLRRCINGILLRKTLAWSDLDPMKLKLFEKPVYWHVGDIDPSWRRITKRARSAIRASGGLTDRAYDYLNAIDWVDVRSDADDLISQTTLIDSLARWISGRLHRLFGPWVRTIEARLIPAINGDRSMWVRLARRARRQPVQTAGIVCAWSVVLLPALLATAILPRRMLSS